jgi:hypothetical protein
VLAAVLVALVPMAITPAQAAGPLSAGGFFKPPTPFEDRGEFDPECEGIDVVVRFHVKGVESIRRVRGSDGQAFFQKLRIRFRETWTLAGTDEVLLRDRGAFLFREVAAVRVRKADVPRRFVPEEGLVGPVFRFTAREIGGNAVTDADGRLLYHQGGLVVRKALFDTLGDSEPGGTFLNERVVRVVGPHPLLDVDLCDVASQQAG